MSCSTDGLEKDFSKEESIVEYLKSSDMVRYYYNKIPNHTGQVKLKVVSHNIVPNLLSFQDSLKSEYLTLSKASFKNQTYSGIEKLSDRGASKLKLFITHLPNQKVYCELFYDSGFNLEFDNGKLSYQGTALQYLFSFNEHEEITNVLNNLINYE